MQGSDLPGSVTLKHFLFLFPLAILSIRVKGFLPGVKKCIQFG